MGLEILAWHEQSNVPIKGCGRVERKQKCLVPSISVNKRNNNKKKQGTQWFMKTKSSQNLALAPFPPQFERTGFPTIGAG